MIFIRHAETDLAGTFCGHSDPELNERGRQQLPEVIEKLKASQIREVYTSDLRRAIQTAQPIAAHFGVPCQSRSALREINFGRWEGLRWSEIEAREPDEARQWLREYPDRDFPQGERLQDFQARVLTEIRGHMEEKRDGAIAIVTHAGVIRTALTRIFGMTEEKAWDCTNKYGSVQM